MLKRDVSLLLLYCCVFSGCVRRVTMPLCPAVALKSFAPGIPAAPGTVVNAFLTQQTTKDEINLNVLSPVAAEFSGKKRDVVHLEQRYPLLLCAFYDPGAPIDYAQVYTTCMQSVPVWTQILQSGKPEDLLLPKTKYADVCVTGVGTHAAQPLTDVKHP